MFFGPFICGLSFLVDLLSVPGVLLRGNKNFEHKYQMLDNLNEKQTQVVLQTFKRIFRGSKAQQYRGKSLSLQDLMDIHGKHFVLIENMHDLMCRGNKDYREALKNVQDYNMSKILSAKCAIPDRNGDFKQGKCEMDIIFNVQQDVQLYNYVDVVLRKWRMGILKDELQKRSKARSQGSHEDLKSQDMADDRDDQAKQKDNEDEEEEMEDQDNDDENKKIGGIEPRKVGPDGVLLFRNHTDLMANFFINISSLAFTDVQKDLQGGTINSSEIKRLKRYEKEIDKRKEEWAENTVGTFTAQSHSYSKHLKKQLDNLRVQAERIKMGQLPSEEDFVKKVSEVPKKKEEAAKKKKSESKDGKSEGDGG